jgi:predicted molibdopterin-dependent oxidoreductase YjgC
MDMRVGWHPVLGDMSKGRLVTISVDGKDVSAVEGEPIAAALYAAGIRFTRRSPRGGELRGPFCMIGLCTECALTIDGESNLKACKTPVREGMVVEMARGGRP